MDNLSLDLDLTGITDGDVTLLQESSSLGMPEFAASCCETNCANSSGSCDEAEEISASRSL